MIVQRLSSSRQRLGTVAELPVLLREHGVDPATVFAGSGLDPETLTPDTYAPLETVVTLLDRAQAEAADPHFGLLLGLRFSLDKHGPIGRLMRTAPTLRDALADFVSWQYAYSTGSIVYLVRMGEDHAFGFGMHVPRPRSSNCVNDFVVAVGVRLVAELTQGKVRPVELHLMRREPEAASAYARLVRCPVVFNRPLNCLILDRAGLATPLPTHDPEERRVLRATMDARLLAEIGHAAQVRRAIRRTLLETAPRMPDIAEDLGLHPRTLRRRLAEEGTRFDDLLDEVRRTVARELIELTDMPMSEIGDALALSSPGVFTDWFRRAFGAPPSAWPRQGGREDANV